MSSQPLLFNVESIYDMRSTLVEQSATIIQNSVVMLFSFLLLINRTISDALENERFERYTIHSAEDYFGPIAKYHLLDEPPTVCLLLPCYLVLPLSLWIYCYSTYCTANAQQCDISIWARSKIVRSHGELWTFISSGVEMLHWQVVSIFCFGKCDGSTERRERWDWRQWCSASCDAFTELGSFC